MNACAPNDATAQLKPRGLKHVGDPCSFAFSSRASRSSASRWPAHSSQAFVSSSVGGHPGEFDASFKVGLESGKIEPNENMRSWQEPT